MISKSPEAVIGDYVTLILMIASWENPSTRINVQSSTPLLSADVENESTKWIPKYVTPAGVLLDMENKDIFDKLQDVYGKDASHRPG
jgi:hypothetical protein